MIITIDGPAGSGKSTVARKLAMRLAFIHLNSGGLFRAVGLKAVQRGGPTDDDAAVAELARELDFQFELSADSETTFRVDGNDIHAKLADEEVGKLASVVGLLPSVRRHLLEVQRAVGQKHSLVVEGRDSGTVVFPDAEFKFYLNATPDVRAVRRLKEQRGSRTNLDEVLKQIVERDTQDAMREFAPHRKADDALLIDTSELTPEEVVERIAEQMKHK